jgi:hypothetical protein
MATIQVILQSPDGVQTDITKYLTADDLPALTLEIEDDSGKWVAGDMSFTARNEDGLFTTLWPLPLDPTAVWDEATARGCWHVKVKKDGTVRWEGDLDPASVAFDAKAKTVAFTVLGKVKRAERHNAAAVRRSVPTPLYITTEVGRRKVSLWVDADHTIPLSAASSNLAVGDKIRCTQLTANGAPVQQDLEIRALGPSIAEGLTEYQVKVRGYPKKAFSSGIVINPWYRGQTVATVVQRLFEHMGLSFDTQCEVSGAGASLIVDEADFDRKTVADALSELAAYASAVWFATPEKWYFLGRDASKSSSSVKDISGLLHEKSAKALYDRFFQTVVARGTKERYYRTGVLTYPSRELEIVTDFTANLDTLKNIAQTAYNTFGSLRATCEVVVRDDGTIYQLRDLVSLDGELWWVIRISEPLVAAGTVLLAGTETPVRGEITLTLLQVTGTTPTAADLDPRDDVVDHDPPYPPINLEIGEGADDAARRPAWWADGWNGPNTGFRAIFPNNTDEWPLVKTLGQYKDDDGDIQTIFGRLWVVRCQNHPDNPVPDGLELTVYKAGKDPSRPVQRHGFRAPTCDADGYYYLPWYKVISPTATDKECVVQTWDMERGFSCYSDPVSTDRGGLVASLVQAATGLTVTFTASASGGAPYTGGEYDFQVDFGDGTVSSVVRGASGLTFQHDYAAPGLYTAWVAAIDAAGNTATAYIHLSVSPGAAGGITEVTLSAAVELSAYGSAYLYGSPPSVTVLTCSAELAVHGSAYLYSTPPTEVDLACSAELSAYGSAYLYGSPPSEADLACSVVLSAYGSACLHDVQSTATVLTCSVALSAYGTAYLYGSPPSEADLTGNVEMSARGSAVLDDGIPSSGMTVTLESGVEDAPGTRAVECYLKVTVDAGTGATIGATSMHVHAAVNGTPLRPCVADTDPTAQTAVAWFHRVARAGDTLTVTRIALRNGHKKTLLSTTGLSVVAGSATNGSTGKPAALPAPTLQLVAGTTSPSTFEVTIDWSNLTTTQRQAVWKMMVEVYDGTTWRRKEPIDIRALTTAGTYTITVKVHTKKRTASGSGNYYNVRAFHRDVYEQDGAVGYLGASGTDSGVSQPSPLDYYQDSTGYLHSGGVALVTDTVTEVLGSKLVSATVAGVPRVLWKGDAIWPKAAIAQANLPLSTSDGLLASGNIIPVWQANGTGALRFRLAVYFPSSLTGLGTNKWAIFKADTTLDAEGGSDPGDPATPTDGGTLPSGNCFGGGTLVLLDNGTTKRLDQVVVGDSVLGMSPEGTLAPQPVLQVYNHPEVDAVSGVLLHGIQATLDHLVALVSPNGMSSRPVWGSVRGLEVGFHLYGLVNGTPQPLPVTTPPPPCEEEFHPWNLRTAFQNYFVSADGVQWYLVHNLKSI